MKRFIQIFLAGFFVGVIMSSLFFANKFYNIKKGLKELERMYCGQSADTERSGDASIQSNKLS